MPSKNVTPMAPDGGAASSAVPDETTTGALASARQPVQLIVAGRGRVGKTSVANALVQFYRPGNPRLQVWNADGHNETNSIARFFPDAREPSHHDLDDLKAWYEGLMQEQATQRFDAVLDIPGGDPLIKKMAQEVRLVATLRRRGIRLVAAHVFGPEKADVCLTRLARC